MKDFGLFTKKTNVDQLLLRKGDLLFVILGVFRGKIVM